MANPRQDVQESSRKVADETSRAATRTAEAGERAARAGSAAVQRSAETAQQAWESGSDVMAEWIRRVTEQFARAFGFTGEGTEKAAEQSLRNVRAMAQSGTVFAQGVQEVSREFMELLRKSIGHNLNWFNAFARSTSPQELAAAQSEIARYNLQDILDATRRTAEVSVRMADEATQRMSDVLETTRRAA
jgi:phasin family protein